MDEWPAENAAHPMQLQSPPLGLYLVSTIGPIVSAAALRLADWKLSKQATFTLTLAPLLYHVCTLESLWKFTFVKRLPGSALFWTLFFAFTRWICFFYVPKERLLVISFALDVLLPIASIASWKHLQADSSVAQQSFDVTLVLNFATMYMFYSILLIRYVVVIWALKVIGTLVCYALGLFLLEKLIKWPAYWIGFGSHFAKVMDFCNEVGTRFLILEALVMEELSRWVQRGYSRCAQHRRETHGVETYEYRPLKEGEIRVLVVKQSSRMQPSVIEGSLIHVSLREIVEGGSDVKFEAISYCWGSANKTDSVLIDGGDFRVTESAFNILLARRSIFNDRTIWIDSICINQSDLVEKTHQIQMMREIYSGARRVIAVPNHGWQTRLAAKTLIELWILSQISWIDVNDFGLKFKAKQSAVVRLLSSDFFSRARIIQEVALGKDVEMYMGGIYMQLHQYMGITTFLCAPERMQRLLQADAPLQAKAVPIVRISNVFVMSAVKYALQTFADKITLDIILLTTARYFNATDPRDKVFSVLGLVTDDNEEQLLKPDYSKSANQVFEDLAKYLFLYALKPSVQLLAAAGVGYTPSRRPLPSWVPDLSERRLNDPFTFPTPFGQPPFRASGESTPDVVTAGNDRRMLVFNGILCDKIAGLSSAGPLPYHGEPGETYEMREAAKARVAFAQAAKQTIKEYGYLWKDGPEELLKNLWRVLIADQIGRKGREDLQSDNFDHWLRFLEVIGNLKPGQNADLAFVQSGWPEQQHLKFRWDGSYATYAEIIAQKCLLRCFAITESGRMCLVPPLTELGDAVFIPFGAQVPYLIRKVALSDGRDVYILIGEAYVHGTMKGELVEAPYVKTAVLIQ